MRGMSPVRSTCPYCGVGCGLLLSPEPGGGIAVKGDPDHPANRGRLCSKGAALSETVGLDGRLLHPQIDGRRADWDSAMDLVASKFRRAIAEHGPDSVAFYVSGQMLTEDYYVANKLMKGFIGSANIDTNSRLCMASTVAGHRRAFGTDTVPGTYQDLDEADLIVLVGSNLAWCHPVLYRRVMDARAARGTKIVVIDPRRTASCDGADLHLPLKIGSDVALFNGLLAEIEARGALDTAYLAHLEGLDDALHAARKTSIEPTGLDDALVARFYRMWIGHRKVVTLFSQGVNQSSAGSDKVNAILNCHLATGRIGKPGMGPLSVTGQPNAMGGREVGGLANMLACHLEIENPAHRAAVRQFWGAPAMPEAAGLKAVEMFEALADGRIKALWVMHSNPAVTLPEADAVREAIRAASFSVVSDITAETDTARLASVLLPASAWSEKSGTVTNSDRTISRQRALRPAPGAARPDWAQMAELGRRLGWTDAFDYESPVEIFREHAALSGIAVGFGRDFDISDLADLSDADYEALGPTRWPVAGARQGGRFFADGASYHPGGKLRMIPVQHRPPATRRARRFPFRLNTGRIRDQWHTMTRTSLSPRLSAHLAEPFVEIHPHDAARFAIGPDSLVAVTSPTGRAILRAQITDAVKPGELFAPMHWTGETAPSARIDALVAAVTDPISGQPESKASVCALAPFRPAFYAFAVSASLITPKTAYWARARTQSGWRAELAGSEAPADWEAWARALFDLPETDVQKIIDRDGGYARLAFREPSGRLLAAVFAGPVPLALQRDYLAQLPGQGAEHALTGRAPADLPDPGPTLCSCFGIGVNEILTAIETGRLASVAAVGAALGAGTNCGSCKPEIAALLAATRLATQEAAE